MSLNSTNITVFSGYDAVFTYSTEKKGHCSDEVMHLDSNNAYLNNAKLVLQGLVQPGSCTEKHSPDNYTSSSSSLYHSQDERIHGIQLFRPNSNSDPVIRMPQKKLDISN